MLPINIYEGNKNNLKKYLKLFLSWRFLICFGLAWMITNGWCYIFIFLGNLLKINWMVIVGTSYAAFLFLPFTLEKIITIPIAIWLNSKLFKNNNKTKEKLENLMLEVKEDCYKIKNKFKRKKGTKNGN